MRYYLRHDRKGNVLLMRVKPMKFFQVYNENSRTEKKQRVGSPLSVR